ncbi:MAG: hypothetical protein ACNA8W_21570 [Bradymonadaceae bacterium]
MPPINRRSSWSTRSSFCLLAALLISLPACKKDDSDEGYRSAQSRKEVAPVIELPRDQTLSTQIRAENFFAFYDFEPLRNAWQGSWVLPDGDLWHVSQDTVSVVSMGQEQDPAGFTLKSPCKVNISTGPGSSMNKTYVVTGDGLKIPTDTVGIVSEDDDGNPRVIVCDSDLTILDGEICTKWKYKSTGHGSDKWNVWVGSKTQCGFEEKEVEGQTYRRFVFQGFMNKKETLIEQDGLLIKPMAFLETPEYFAGPQQARARYEALRQPEPDSRELAEVTKSIVESLADSDSGGTIFDPWFDYDTRSHYEEVRMDGCELSALRVFQGPVDGEVRKQARRLTIDLARGKNIEGRRIDAWLRNEAEETFVVGEGLEIHGDGLEARIELCEPADDSWRCKPEPEQMSPFLVVQHLRAWRRLSTDMSRAVELCR